MLLFGFVESDDGFGDLIDEITLEVGGFQIQIASQLAEQIPLLLLCGVHSNAEAGISRRLSADGFPHHHSA